MKTNHKYTFINNRMSFFLCKSKNHETLAICNSFVRKLSRNADCQQVDLTIRKKNPKEKGFTALTLDEDGAVHFQGVRFYVCVDERDHLKKHGFGNKFWIKIETIS